MVGKIATKSYCNTLSAGAFSPSERPFNECPTYNEIISKGVFEVSGSHSGNQLVLESEISASAKIKFGFYTTNPSNPCTIVTSGFRVTSDVEEKPVEDQDLSMTLAAWQMDPKMGDYGYYPLGEISGTEIVSSSGTLKVNGVNMRDHYWDFIGSSVVDWALNIDR